MRMGAGRVCGSVRCRGRRRRSCRLRRAPVWRRNGGQGSGLVVLRTLPVVVVVVLVSGFKYRPAKAWKVDRRRPLVRAEVGPGSAPLLLESPVVLLLAWAFKWDALRPCPLPLRGISFRDWKFLGLLPRTIMAPDVTSQIGIFPPVASKAITFKRTTKCCCEFLAASVICSGNSEL